jgi:hypothetical protein
LIIDSGISGQKGIIMNKNRITAMVAIVALVGLIHTFAALDNHDVTVSNNISGQNNSEPKPLVDTSTPVTTAPAPTFTQPDETLLSEVKVYPTF